MRTTTPVDLSGEKVTGETHGSPGGK
jgi:hypothetical protein